MVKDKKKTARAAAVVLLFIAAAAMAFGNFSNTESHDIAILSEEDGEREDLADEEKEEDWDIIYIHVSGAVLHPGVIQLKEGSRVFEAVDLAGGMTEEAHKDSVNLAAVVLDGEQVYIPTKKEAEQGGGGVKNSDVSSYSGNSAEKKININKADSSALQNLKGVGPAMAEKIIQYRTEAGGFKAIEDLKKVKGIGDKTFEKLKDQICVN